MKYTVMPATVLEALRQIEREAGDPEEAHCLEDRLWESVLQAIAAETCDDPATCAAEALRSKDIEFPRWYA